MEIYRQQPLSGDVSECWSFGSNYHPCSQSRKMSIGIMVESLSQIRPNSVREGETTLPTAEIVTSKKGIVREDRCNGEEITGVTMGKQMTSPWVSTGSFDKKSPTPEGVHKLPAKVYKRQRLNNGNKSTGTYSVQYLASQMLIDGKLKKLDKVLLRRGGKDGTVTKVENCSNATAAEVFSPNKAAVQDEAIKTENRGNETLRMKLWEILGNVLSPNKQFSNSQALEADANNLQPKRKLDDEGDLVVKHKKNSDTIESDSESPNQTLKRPTTRSLASKKVAVKVQLKKSRNSPSSGNKAKQPEKNIFCFGDGSSRRLRGTVNGGSPMSKKIEKTHSNNDPHRMPFPGQSKEDETQQANYRNETDAPAEKSSMHGTKSGNFSSLLTKNSKPVNSASPISKIKNSTERHAVIDHHRMSFSDQEKGGEYQQATYRNTTETLVEKSLLMTRIGDFSSSLLNRNNEPVEPNRGGQELDSQLSPVMKMIDEPKDNEYAPSQKNLQQQENLANLSFKNIVDPQYHLHSPTLEKKSDCKSSSPDLMLNTNHGKLNDDSPVRKMSAPRGVHSISPAENVFDAERMFGSKPAERSFGFEGIHKFRKLQTSKRSKICGKVGPRLSDYAGELEDSPVMESVPLMEEKEPGNELSKSSSEESDSGGQENPSPVEGQRHIKLSPPEISAPMKSRSVLHPDKRLSSEEDVKIAEFNPISASPEGSLSHTNEMRWVQKLLDEHYEDGLASVVTLFASAVERLKFKIKSVTRKRSAEILTSAAEEILLQLQNTELQIQADVEKLTTHGKLKRKRLEARFKEQQEQLKVIYQNFREKLNQHLDDCRGTIEGLEAHQIEFKGNVEQQKASHKKLLLQMEEAMEIRLNDAQRKITTVHKYAREKMLQLHYVIGQCLKEGILS